MLRLLVRARVVVTLVFIGLLGFTFDFALRLVQNRILFWLPKGQGGLGG